MNDRRSFLHKSAHWALAGAPMTSLAGLAGCTTNTTLRIPAPSTEQAAAHALNRLGFGPRPGDIATVGRDVASWIEQQLRPSTIALPNTLTQRLDESRFATMDVVAVLREFTTLVQANQAQAQAMAGLAKNPDGTAMAAPGAPEGAVGPYVQSYRRPAHESRLLRALESPRQLEEVMVDFWFNHFNVFEGKNVLRVLVGHYEHHAIRPFAMGRFRDLLGATAHHPAMLYYLDNWQSVGGRAQGNRGLNENYARELMELHTLGADGGYSQADVTQLARMLTGWTIKPFRAQAALAGGLAALGDSGPASQPGFWFNERVHDHDEKRWLGQRITAKGKAEGDHALDVLARHPATARHICFKLAQYFVSDKPDPSLVAHLAKVFSTEDGHIVPVLRALFQSDAFWDSQAIGSKFKSPYHYTVSALRAGGYTQPSFQGMLNSLAAQGMPLYGCQTPDGYKNTEAAWLNPDATAKRINFASQLATGRLASERLQGGLKPEALIQALGPLVTPATRQLAQQNAQDPALALALVLAGPGMMRR